MRSSCGHATVDDPNEDLPRLFLEFPNGVGAERCWRGEGFAGGVGASLHFSGGNGWRATEEGRLVLGLLCAEESLASAVFCLARSIAALPAPLSRVGGNGDGRFALVGELGTLSIAVRARAAAIMFASKFRSIALGVGRRDSVPRTNAGKVSSGGEAAPTCSNSCDCGRDPHSRGLVMNP
mmetsp:Transcript_9790/g.29945  ORF Transcript_9790/g.29945 Transcript_9790/m.29945 type:complete len:180 (+) Transcript_9790:202-741(+)